MGADELAVRTERYIDQALFLQQGVHHGQDGGPMVVPLEAELLPHPIGAGSGGRHGEQRSGVSVV